MKIFKLVYRESDPTPVPGVTVTDYIAAESEQAVFGWFEETKEASRYLEGTWMRLIALKEVNEVPEGIKVRKL